MSGVKCVLEKLKYVECEHRVGGKNPLIWFVSKQDPIQDFLKTITKMVHFKLMLS